MRIVAPGASKPTTWSPSISGCCLPLSRKSKSNGASGGISSCQSPWSTRTFSSAAKSSAAARALVSSSSTVTNGTAGGSAETIHTRRRRNPCPSSPMRALPRWAARTYRSNPTSRMQERSKPSSRSSASALCTSGGSAGPEGDIALLD